jgi:hypothetical protein
MKLSMTLKAEGLQPVGLIYQTPVDGKPLVEPDAPIHGPADLNISVKSNSEALTRVMETYRIY